jgi:outer membrane protein TolC
LAVCSLAGCARFEPRPLAVTATADALEQRRLDTPELRAFLETNLGPVAAWPLPRWSFEQLALVALQYHPRLELARAQLAEARAAEVTAGARPNPTVSVVPQYTANAASGVSPWLATVQFDVPIETAGKRQHRRARAQHLTEASQQELVSAAWEVRSALRTAWLDLCDAVQQTNLLSRQVAAQGRVLAALEAKLNAGAATSAEAAPARVAAARAASDLAEARARVHETQAALAAALAIPRAALPPLAALVTPPTAPALAPAAEARRRALTSRADLLGLLAEYAATESSLQLEVARQYPDLHLNPGYEFDQGENKWALGVALELPVLNQNQGPIAEAHARRAAAAARVLARQTQILGELDRAWAAWEGAESRRAALDTLRDAQRAQVSALQAQLDAGATEALDLRLAEAELAAGELPHWNARLKSLRALGALEDAVQFPLSPAVQFPPRPTPP